MNKVPETISLIIPCYNQAKFLVEAVESIAGQNYQNLEILLVNDGSTDETEVIAKKLASQHKNIRFFSQVNKGPSSARNVALKEAQGEYILFLDADDFLVTNQLFTLSDFLQKNQEVSIVYTAGRYIGESSLVAKRSEDLWGDYTTDPLTSLLTRGNFILIHSAMFRRDLLGKVGLFDESLWRLEDWDFWLRCAEHGAKFAYLPGIQVPYRIHGENSTESGLKMVEARIMVLKKLLQTANLQPEQREVIIWQLVIAYLGAASRHLVGGKRDLARENVQSAERVMPASLYVRMYRICLDILPAKLFIFLLRLGFKTI